MLDKKASAWWIQDMLMLTAAIFIFYICWLGSYPLFTPDEGRYTEIAREMLSSGDYITPRLNGVSFLDKPILYYWLQAIALALFGVKEWAVRLMPVLLGTWGCIMTYVCGRQLFDRRTGLFSAIILATTPLYFSGTHYANLDLEVAVWISCTLLCFITGVQSKKHAGIFLYFTWFFAACAFLTKGLIGIAFPSMIIGTWILLQNRWNLLLQIHLGKGIILFLACTLPWYWLVQQANPDFFHYFFVTQQFSRFLSTQVFNNPSPWWFYFPVLLVGFLPWTSFLFQSLHAAVKSRQSTEIFLILWAAIIFIFFSIPHSKIMTYILPVFPALALLVGKYLASANECQWQRDTRIFSLINIIFAVILLANAHYHWLKLPLKFNPWFYGMACIYLLSALAGLIMSQPKKYLMPIAVSCNILFLLTLTTGAKFLNENSAKFLVAHLKTILQPEDEVVTWLDFFQDVPLYLQRKVNIVADWDAPGINEHDNWMRELAHGRQTPQSLLINENQFWEKWDSDKHVYIFMHKKYIESFKMQASQYHIIAVDHGIVLATNISNEYPPFAENESKNGDNREHNEQGDGIRQME